jgi:hypothetical protein
MLAGRPEHRQRRFQPLEQPMLFVREIGGVVVSHPLDVKYLPRVVEVERREQHVERAERRAVELLFDRIGVAGEAVDELV